MLIVLTGIDGSGKTTAARALVDSARADYVGKCGLPEEEFFADAFTSEADLHQF